MRERELEGNSHLLWRLVLWQVSSVALTVSEATLIFKSLTYSKCTLYYTIYNNLWFITSSVQRTAMAHCMKVAFLLNSELYSSLKSKNIWKSSAVYINTVLWWDEPDWMPGAPPSPRVILSNWNGKRKHSKRFVNWDKGRGEIAHQILSETKQTWFGKNNLLPIRIRAG